MPSGTYDGRPSVKIRHLPAQQGDDERAVAVKQGHRKSPADFRPHRRVVCHSQAKLFAPLAGPQNSRPRGPLYAARAPTRTLIVL